MARTQRRPAARNNTLISAAAEAANPPASRLSRWIVPDVAMVATIALLFYCLFSFHAEANLFKDSDSGWHIRTGDWVLAHGAVPRADPFSFLQVGRPWFAWEWGADLVMSLFHTAAGLPGVAAFYVAAIALSGWLWFRWNRELGANLLIACAVAAPLISSTQVHWLARPHVLSWIFLLAFMFLIERAGARFGWRDALLFGGLTVLWATVHASFFLAGEIAILYAIGRWIMGDRQRSIWCLKAAFCIGVATFVNPYGWNLHLHIVEFFQRPEWRVGINEWEPADFGTDGMGQILTVVLIVGAGALVRAWQRRWDHALVMAVITISALSAARGLPVTALICLPMAAAGFSDLLKRINSAKPLLGFGADLEAIDRDYGGYAWVPVMIAALVVWSVHPAIRERGGYRPEIYPTGADSLIAALPPESRILASDLWGGYIIYRFSGSPKAYFDGRVDYYTTEPKQRFLRIIKGEASWRRDLAEVGFTHALIDTRWPVAKLLETDGWINLWRSGTFALYQRPFVGSAKAAPSGAKRKPELSGLAAGSGSVLREFLRRT